MSYSIKDKIEIAKAFTKELEKKHIYLDNHLVFDNTDDLMESVNSPVMAMDFTPNAFNTPSNGVPQALLTSWVKDIVRPVHRKYTYQIVGSAFQQGDFATTVMQIPTLSYTGFMEAYIPGFDGQSAGVTNANLNYVQRNIQKLQIFLTYNELEEATMSYSKINIVNEKRLAMMNIIEQTRDDMFYYGLSYNTGVKGLLNDSNLNATIVLPAAAGNPASSSWASKSYQEKQDDILLMFNQLVKNMVNNINVNQASPMVFVLSPLVLTYFVKKNDFGQSIKEWMQDTFPSCEIVTAIQYSGATGSGDNLMQLFLKEVGGMPTVCHGFSYNLRAHRVIYGTDYLKQKYSIGDAGSIVRLPIAVVTSSGS